MKILPGLARMLYLLFRFGSVFWKVKLFFAEDTACPNGFDSVSSSLASSATFSSAIANSRSDCTATTGAKS